MKILKLLSKYFIILLLFSIFAKTAISNEPVDIWNIEKKEWEIKHGSYQILIGSSSAEIFLEEKITL